MILSGEVLALWHLLKMPQSWMGTLIGAVENFQEVGYLCAANALNQQLPSSACSKAHPLWYLSTLQQCDPAPVSFCPAGV